MANKIESYMCLLEYTDYLCNLLFHNSKDIKNDPDLVEVINILENWENFKSIDEIKKIKNIHIQKAIEELENNQELMNTLKENN